MKEKQVHTQAELDKAIKDGFYPLLTAGEFIVRGSSQVTAYGSSQVRAYGSSQVTAYGSSQVRAYDSSQVRAYDSSQVTAYGSSQVTACDSSQVTAYGSSQVTAYGSSQVRAYDSSQVTASKFVAVSVHGKTVKVVGGKVIRIVRPKTVLQWCSFYGVPVKNGVVTLFKSVSNEFKSGCNFDYSPGTKPKAPDWDGGQYECGGGLHFCPRPFMAIPFLPDAKRFVACPVRVKDIRAPKESDNHPTKVKASGCCAPVWECDIDGNPIKA